MTGKKSTMRFGTLEVPKALYEAQVAGKLVVFAGAGVSFPSPSNIPLFGGLATHIAHGTSITREPIEEQQLDRYIGRLEKAEVNVRKITYDRLTAQDSKPTRMHNAILSLFDSAESVRIVTTNYDAHFTTAFKEKFLTEPEQYNAPALPLGHTFEGITYIHGFIFKDLRNIVLTDRDFGKAYLIEGWATRFLYEMLSTYTVLFVGYSHDDTVMNYLTRGLPEGRSPGRYILTHREQNERWWHLGVEPIVYPIRPEEPDEHVAVVEGIESWSTHARLETIEHERFIKDVVSRPPPVDDEGLDRVRFVLEKEGLIRFFVNNADSPEWLQWTIDNGYLKQLFESEEAASTEGTFAWWLAEKFVCQRPELVMKLIMENKNRVHSPLWNAIVRVFSGDRRDAATTETVHIWIHTLLATVPVGVNPQWLDYLLKACKFPGDLHSATQLFIYLTRPYLSFSSGTVFDSETNTIGSKPEADIAFYGGQHWLEHCWSRYFKPNLERLASYLLEALVANLKQAYCLLIGAGRDIDSFDPISRSRSAIEEHGQNSGSGDILHELISALRDVLAHFVQTDNPTARYILSWKINAFPLFRRFAIHSAITCEFLTHSERIAWLSDFDITDGNCHHEIYSLIKSSYPGADAASRQGLIDRIVLWKEVGQTDIEQGDHRRFRQTQLLDWTSQADPQCQIAKAAFESAKALYTQYLPFSHPDFTTWSGSWRGGSEETSPYSTEELLRLDLEEKFESLCDWHPEHRFDRRTRFLSEVEKACDQDGEWRQRLLTLLMNSRKSDSDLWTPVLSSLTRADFDEATWRSLLEIAEIVKSSEENAERFITFLSDRAKRDGGIPDNFLMEVFQSGEKVWEAIPVGEDSTHERSDWYTAALNNLGGRVTDLWTHLLSRYVNQSKEEGIIPPPDLMLTRLSAVVSGDSRKAQMGLVILASHLSFYFAVANEWARSNLLPALSWSNQHRAAQVWHGYLISPRLSKSLLPVIVPQIETTYAHLDKLGRYRKVLCQLVAGLSILEKSDPYPLIQKFIETVSEEDRATFAGQIELELKEMSEDGRKEQWNRWIRKYWEYRNVGKPKPLLQAELEGMYDWILTSPYIFSESVDLICSSSAVHVGQRFFLNRLDKSSLVATNLGDVIRLLKHLLTTVQADYDCASIAKIVETIVDHGLTADPRIATSLREICNGLADRQYSGAEGLLGKIAATDGL